ncbi:hypothetical protein LNP04_16975 [Chryseobacterium sp. C-71]|uniref:ORC-CDC6 family AAA ATPase n=1 Tax=Chryseobacterium sp. C-71 TaxID=2893882 RepID=UPI001E529A47|nr:hypothetical protein [Chryseobacterium sp. C-71]UFH31641.1 hypothetical protein LNP04_16975 [Chryseobacterium sp. C-71]
MKNPFDVKTPEGISAEDAHELFVDVFTDFYQVNKIGHAFLNGPRGSGKSMMFRYMMPDCQKLSKNSSLKEIDYFSLYVPFKLTDINYVELERFKQNSNIFINEHLLTTFVTSKCFVSLLKYEDEINACFSEIEYFYNNTFLWHVEISGAEIDKYKKKFNTGIEYIKQIVSILDSMLIICKNYCKRSLIPDSREDYNGPLCNYLDFLYPLLLELKKLSFMPQDRAIFILADDAGYLNETQTKILNTWVSYRTSDSVSIKISTQLDYKSYLTITNKTIDSPHDYSKVNIATIYTTSNNNYYHRIEDIVTRRLKKYLQLDISPKDFFPPDKEQVKKIKEIYDKLKNEYEDSEKKHTAGDAARRYASSEYLKFLKNKRSGSTLNYAGFNNLVDISSGIIRHFLEPASIMFSENISKNGAENDVKFLPVNIQNEVIQNYSRKFLEDEFESVKEVHGIKGENEILSKADKLFNMISGLGQMFHRIFVSEKKERVVFSVALYDNPDRELAEIIDLAEHYGYIHRSSIGNKEGTGRCKLYILSRTLAPYFRLDPNGFKGYKFMNSDILKISLTDPKKFEKIANKQIEDSQASVQQLNLFDDL